MPTYLPTTSLTPLYTFVQFSSTVSAFQTALTAAFPGLNIQVFQDTTAGQTTWAVVVVNDSTVLSVQPNNYVGYNQGSWSQYTPTKLGQTFTAYP